MSAASGSGTVITASVTDELSDYIAGALRRELPPTVVEKAKHHVLDGAAAMVSGSRLKPGRVALAYVRAQGGTAKATVAGTSAMTTPVDAALANGVAAHADETDDSHPAAMVHPGCVVLPAALACAETYGRTGEELLRAVVLGYDLACRFVLALGGPRKLFRSGRCSAGIGGTVGAAAAAGALAGLGAPEAHHLLSYAVAQASGTLVWSRDDEHIQKAFEFGGMPARNGVTAAMLVASGFTGVRDSFAGESTWFDTSGAPWNALGALAASAADTDANELVRDLGREYEIERTNLKRWSAGAPMQAALDALEHLMREHRVGLTDIAKITVRLEEQATRLVDDTKMQMPDVNIQHCLALMLVDGTFTFAGSHDRARITDPSVLAAKGLVEVVADPSLAGEQIGGLRQAIVEVETTDGRRLGHHVVTARGQTANPMTRDELAEKSLDLLGPVLGTEQSQRLVDATWTLDALDDARHLGALHRVSG